jgi:hypothetical protein
MWMLLGDHDSEEPGHAKIVSLDVTKSGFQVHCIAQTVTWHFVVNRVVLSKSPTGHCSPSMQP